MSEYDGPTVNNFHLATDGVALPTEAFDTPQRLIVDLADGEWGIVYPGTIRADQSSDKLIIDSFDPVSPQFVPNQMRYRPFVLALGSRAACREYIVDARRVGNFRFPLVDVDLDQGLDSLRFLERQKRFGAQVVNALVVRNFDDVDVYGPSHLEVPSALFAQDVDSFLEQNREEIDKDISIEIPSSKSMDRNLQFHTFSLESSIFSPKQ